MLILLIVVIFWIFTLFLHGIFKSCMLPPYMNLLNSGLSVNIGSIQLYTTRWNRCLQKWGCWRTRLQKKWFNIGIVATCTLMPVATILLLTSLRNMMLALFQSDIYEDSAEPQLKFIQPVLPGINIPLSDLPYYIITLLLCSVLHEIGHALAATREDVKVQGFGVFFMIIFPGAFVDLPTDQMNLLTPWQQLRIFCAGVWHNIVMALVCVGLLRITPFLANPLFEQGNGITVLDVVSESGIAGHAGLSNGDVITRINYCTIKSINSWTSCLDSLSKNSQNGFCASLELAQNRLVESPKKNDNNFECCDAESQSDLCFTFYLLNEVKYSCLSARKVLDYTSNSCKSSEECKHGELEVCLHPAFKGFNTTRLASIERREEAKVIFFGPLQELLDSVSVVDYVPRHKIFSARILHIWETFLKYIVAFSGALAILNVIPCFYLDGKFILQSLVDFLLSPFQSVFNPGVRKVIVTSVTSFGTLLLVTLVICGVGTLVKTTYGNT